MANLVDLYIRLVRAHGQSLDQRTSGTDRTTFQTSKLEIGVLRTSPNHSPAHFRVMFRPHQTHHKKWVSIPVP
jgi:hypothetical protein